MGRFEQDFKNYESYQDCDCYRKTVPDGLVDSLADFYANACGADGNPERNVSRMVSVASDLLVMAGKKASTNWDVGVLRTEIKAALHMMCEVKFDRFMDGTRKAAERLYKEIPQTTKEDFLRKVNCIFNDSNFGYNLQQSVNEPDTLIWEAIWKAAAGVAALSSASESLEEAFPEAFEHIQQAKDHILRPDDPRSRKDSVRDAMSAMEAMLKKLAFEKDIKDATKKLRDEKCWGLDQIVKDGVSIWDHIHRLYPDIRHGQPTCSEIDLEEALYWVGRIAVYITYMTEKKKAIGR